MVTYMTKEERNGLAKTGIVAVAGVVNVVIFGFDLIAIVFFVTAVAIFVTNYLPAHRRANADNS